MAATVKGSCYCGEVKFVAQVQPPAFSVYCHCKECRQAHACPLYQVVTLPDAAVTVEGEENVQYANTKQPMFKRGFCTKCGTRIFNTFSFEQDLGSMKAGKYRAIFPGTFDDKLPEEWKPTAHVFCKEAIIPMSSLSDGLPKYKNLHFTGDSEQVV